MRNVKRRRTKLDKNHMSYKDDFEKALEKYFHGVDEFMKKYYPKHRWSKLSPKDRKRIWNKVIPSEYSEQEWNDLNLIETCKKLAETHDDEIQLRREADDLYKEKLIELSIKAKRFIHKIP